VPYIDSTGLGFLAGSRVTAQNASVSIVLAGVNEHVRRILDGVRLTPFFVLAANESEAVSMVNATSQPSAANPTPPKASKARKKP
jgi:anti-anti-sigma regulatory factor